MRKFCEKAGIGRGLELLLEQMIQHSHAFMLVHCAGQECTTAHHDIDYGQDYLFWTSEHTLSQCKEACESNPDCDGITWVSNSNRLSSAC